MFAVVASKSLIGDKMKYLVLILALIGFNASANEACKNIYDFAKVVMDARQNSTPMMKVIEVVKDSQELQKIIISAYEQPLYSTDGYKKQATEEFANALYIQCMKYST